MKIIKYNELRSDRSMTAVKRAKSASDRRDEQSQS